AHDQRATRVELFKLGEKNALSKTTDAPNSETGKLSIAIPADKKLVAGDVLVARPDFGKESAPVTVTAGKPKPPTVAALKEGDKTVTGWVDATDDVDHAIALVLDHSKQVVEQKTGDVDATT